MIIMYHKFKSKSVGFILKDFLMDIRYNLLSESIFSKLHGFSQEGVYFITVAPFFS